jgi:hypothetical protein
VRVSRNGITRQKHFGDGPTGDRVRSLADARAWRDVFLRDVGPRVTFKRHDVRNKTGVVGVSLERYKVRRHVFWRYSATWPSDRGPVARRFGVKKYGKRGAFERAVAARREALARLEAEGRQKLLAKLDRSLVRLPQPRIRKSVEPGWLLTLTRAGRRHSEFFPDERHGGPREGV